jgi:hypothetical protein
MIIHQLKDYPMPEDYELIFFGDNQEGNIATALEKYNECIQYVLAAPNRYAIHMGDAIDAFWVDDKRYDPDTTTKTPIKQANAAIKQLEPLAKENRLLAVLLGNHEWALIKKAGNLTEDIICPELRKISGTTYPLYGTFSSLLTFYNQSLKAQFKIYATHGRRTITSVSPDPHRRLAYMQYRLKRLLEPMVGDCICMVRGHSHIVLVTPPLPALYLTSNEKNLKQNYTKTVISGSYIPPDHRWYGCSGSFLKSLVPGVNTYSEMAEYAPTELGYLIGEVGDGQFVNLREVKI